MAVLITVDQCPLCSNSQSSLFDQRFFHEEVVVNRQCGACGLVYQSPRKSDEALAAFYEQEYRLLYQGSEGPNPKDLVVQRSRAQVILRFARPGLAQVTRHLDIGCSAGLLLKEFQAAYTCQAIGVEPGNAYRAFAIQQGLQVAESLEMLPTDYRQGIDLVSMAHVLEHLADPVHYLRAVRQEWLNPSGYLLVEVPNLYAHDSFEVAHLISYSWHTLEQVIQQAGFEILLFQQHGQPRSKILPLYLTLLARPAQNPVSSPVRREKLVRLKRNLGMLRRRVLTRLFPRLAWLPIS